MILFNGLYAADMLNASIFILHISFYNQNQILFFPVGMAVGFYLYVQLICSTFICG